MKTVHARTLALRIAALAAAGLVLTACNDDEAATGAAGQSTPTATASAGGKPSGKPTGKASDKPSSSAVAGGDAAAQARTDKLALTPADWGAGFETRDDDDTSLTNYTMDKSCLNKEDGTVKGLVANTGRYVRAQRPDGEELWGSSVAAQFTTADAAHQDMAESAANVRRCPNYKDEDGTETISAHDIESPKVPGADEVYSEEGLAVYHNDDGTTTPERPYSAITARKGPVVVTVFVDLAPNQQVFEGRAQVRALLQKVTAKW
ncbi:hypothetical protein ACIQF6_27420 [Kitasatospora sp. NPDC092948]|uniref:hypothetical protein n=1 Tax=Kitasatospora sp. NPDC092948 TaxID=3364088 RepID=UPI0037FFB517